MRIRRWLTRFVLGSLAIIVVAAATLPWWFDSALHAVGPRYGLTFGRYERVGYARFVLWDVRYARGAVVVGLSRIETDTPLLWAWRHVRGEPNPTGAGNWSVDVAKSTAPHPPRDSGWVPLRRTLRRVADRLDQWLPTAAVGAGVVRWPNGQVSVDSVTWSPNRLSARQVRYKSYDFDATLAFAADDTMRLSARTTSDASTKLELTSRGENLSGSLVAWKQQVAIDAVFPSQGWVPARAGVQSDHVDLPGARLKLGDLYGAVKGHAYVGWQTDHFVADIAVKGTPVPGKSVPPLDVNLRGRGDRSAFTIQAIDLVAPGVVAHLTEPVTIDRAGKLSESAARFWVRADLSQQRWVKAHGTAIGQAAVVSEGAKPPRVQFRFAADAVSIAELSLQHVDLDGTVAWPKATVEHLNVTVAPGEELHVRGGWDFREKALLAAVATGSVRYRTVARWLPASVSFAQATFDAHASGAIAALEHGGKAEVTDVRFAKLNPATVNVSWEGQGAAAKRFDLAGTIGAARIRARGAADRSGLTLADLRFAHGQDPELHLEAPAKVSWRPGLVIDDVRLVSDASALGLRLQWGAVGGVEFSTRNFPAAWARDFVPMPGPAWTISSCAVSGKWDAGPMHYSAAGGITFALGSGRLATVNFSGRGDDKGLRVEALHGQESGHDVVNASGRIPLVIAPGTKHLAAIDARGALALEATTVPNAAFWQQLAAITGVEMRDPEVRAHLAGTWRRPEGTLSFRATRLAMDPRRFARALPVVESVDVALTGNPDGLHLDRFDLAIEGQAVRASGKLPVPENGWSELIHQPMAFLERGAQGRLEVPDAQVAAFSRFLPAALAPAGRIAADVRYDRGALGGFLRLRDAASRPLGPLGVLQQVNADVAFSAHEVNLQRVVATAGGEPIELSGRVVLPSTGWFGGTPGEPKYDVSVRGRNLPFVRQAGLLVRGDIDLKLQSPDRGQPRITGKVTLRDSLFLADVRSFLPHGGGASPSRRPPYFSVETPPLNAWVLDVDLVGDRFLRLRTPVFSGAASAHFHLGGTLGEPRAIGDARIDQGQVLMPFATFDVAQGAVRLTEDDPYQPTIYLRGTGRRYGYDLTLEITGKASSPDITFRSSPSLDPAQVTMMVMTGAAPSNEVSTSLTHRALQFGEFFGHSLFGTFAGAGEADRLSVTSGEKISEQGNETYDIEYKLNDRWALTGEYDEFDEYNVGLKWRLAPKKERR